MPTQSPSISSSIETDVFVASDLSWTVNKTLILKNINLKIRRNKITGVIGPNGAGKSSLLRCFFGKNKISSGSLTFNTKEISSYSRRELAQNIAVVLQEPPTQFDMDVFELVSLGLIPNLKLLSFPTAKDKQRVISALADVELTGKQHCSFNTLSGGEKQRVMLARAIVQQTKIMILDEPTNHLDIQHQIDILHLIKKLNITIILSIHDLNIASLFCDELILMDEGNIVSQGKSRDVLTESNLKNVFKVNAKIETDSIGENTKIDFDLSKIISKTESMLEGKSESKIDSKPDSNDHASDGV